MIEPIDLAATQPPTAPAGRKMQTVTQAARQLFLEQGFSATSMDAIAKAAGVSKATLYAYFPSKETLFAFLIKADCEEFTRPLPEFNLAEGLYAALRRFAFQYAKIFTERKDVALVRVIANESRQFPELGRLFYESGPRATTLRLANFLDEAKAQGLLDFEDSCIAATQFLSLIRGERPFRSMLGISDTNEQTLSLEIEAGLKLFLKACRPSGA